MLGEDHPDRRTSILNMGVLLTDIGDYGAVERLCRPTLESRRRVRGDEHPDTRKTAKELEDMMRRKAHAGTGRLTRLKNRALKPQEPSNEKSRSHHR